MDFTGRIIMHSLAVNQFKTFRNLFIHKTA